MVIHADDEHYTVTIRIHEVDGKHVAEVMAVDEENWSDVSELGKLFDEAAAKAVAQLDAEAKEAAA